MVFKLIKNLLSPKPNSIGTLYKNTHVILSQATFSIFNDTLLFTAQTSKSFPFNSIKDVQINTGTVNSLSFTMKNESYIFMTMQNLENFRNSLPIKKEEVLMKLKGSYYIYVPEKGIFETEEENADVVIVKECDSEKSFLKIKNRDVLLHEEEIDGQSTFRTQGDNRFIWNVRYRDSFYTFCLRFKNRVEFLEFVSKYTTRTNKVDNPDEYMVGEECEREEHEEEDDYTGIFESSEDEEKNNYLCTSKDRAFVSRGSSIGVFNIGDEVEFQSSIKNLKFGHSIEPDKMVSHDSTVYILDKNDKASIYRLDLERGKIVENYEFQDNIQDFFDAEKLQSGPIVSVSEKGLYKFDPRINQVVSKNVYKTNNHFRCGMSTEDGKLAVASANGNLRLYDNLEKRAKMLLPGYGDEILGVDRSSNGRYVLCTCKTYILLYDLNTDGKPVPKRLYIKPEHISYMKESISFTPAVFSTDGDDSILAGTGHYVITWMLPDVLKGIYFNYHIKKYSDLVVGEQFNDKKIVVALKDDIKMTRISGMKNPEKIVRERRGKR